MAASPELSIMEACVDIIKTVGFPIFVSCWLLLRTDKRLDKIIELMSGKGRG